MVQYVQNKYFFQMLKHFALPVRYPSVRPCKNKHRRMLNRALFYTAETRAKIRVIVVGDWEAVVRAINTTDTDRRNTALAERINELIKE